jgi:hypothetical protein
MIKDLRVNIVDALMGRGKTSAMINYINASDEDTRFLYITPYLTEVTRIINKCPTKAFKQPEVYGTKMRSVKYLFEKGINIVSTHSLFKLFDREIIDLAYNNNYVLILVNILDHDKLNQIGEMDGSLSMGWYSRNKDNVLMQQLKNNLGNYFKNYTKTQSRLNLWTTFKEFKTVLSGKGYTKGYLSSNMRATNDYKDRTAVAYCINKYFNPYIKNFFISNSININEDAYALSEMIQWIFRSAIREDMPIQAYIPSKRMRELFENWLYM